MSAPILHLSVSQRPVFLLNSCLSLFSVATLVAPLLPKLRGHFAEFLNNTSPVGLWIFSSSTCVGLRYGYIYLYSGFSRQCGFRNFVTFLHSLSHFTLCCGFAYSHGFVLSPVFHHQDSLSSCVPTVLNICSTGISTCCPSITALALTLGPDLP